LPINLKIKKHLPIILVLCIVLVSGLLTYKTYGTYWDEFLQRDMGKMSYNYLFHNDDALKTFMDKDYGVLIELPLYIMEVKLFANNFEASIEARHLCCFLIFMFGLAFFYALLLKLKFNSFWATIGTIMLVLSPRIYGHAFFNSKDIPLLVFYIITFYSLLLLIEKQNYRYAILHAIVTALLINIRITGVVVYPFTIFFLSLILAIEAYNQHQPFVWFKVMKLIGVYIFVSVVFIYLFWPFLWENPFHNFMMAFSNMSKFRWDGYSYLMGEHIRSIKTPWYYLPKWIAITTPVYYMVIFAGSLVLLVSGIFRKRLAFFKETNNLNQLMVLCFLIIPVLVIIVLNSTLYDSWRHVYFIYPFMIVSGLYALNTLALYLKKYKLLVPLVTVFFISFEFIKMIKSHPYHYVYFNEIPDRKRNKIVQENDFDFWGVSFKQAYEKLLQLDQRKVIKITATVSPAYYNFLLMKEHIKDCRLEFVAEESMADYYFTNYRFNPKDHSEFKDKKYFSLEYANSEFITVFKTK
jgi:hypothetical protein